MHPVYFIHSALPGALLFCTFIILMEIILTPILLVVGALVGMVCGYALILGFIGIVSAPIYGIDFIINKAKRHSDTP